MEALKEILEDKDLSDDALIAKLLADVTLLSSVQEVFASSPRLRDLGPLMISGVVKRFDEHPDLASTVLLTISRICRYHEGYTFFFEAFIDSPDKTQLSAVLIDCITNTVKLARTGPLAKRRVHFLVQSANQILSRISQKVPTEVEQPLMRYLEVAGDAEVFKDQMESMAEIVWKDAVAVLLLRVNRYLVQKYFHNFVGSAAEELHTKFFAGGWKYSNISNYVFTRVKNFRHSESSLTDVQEGDVAWYITSAFLGRKIFKINTAEFTAALLSKAAMFHLSASEPENLAGVGNIAAALKLSEIKIPYELLFRLVRVAVTAPPRDGPLGDECNGLDMSDRQHAYLAYCEAMKRFTLREAMEATRLFVKQSRNDSEVGIFIKVGKDCWASAAIEESEKYAHIPLEIFDEISRSEFAVLDATDSLSAILNWMRVVLVRTSCDWTFVSGRLDVVKRKIDAEFRNPQISDLQRTRVLLIGDLTKCVSDLLSTRNLTL